MTAVIIIIIIIYRFGSHAGVVGLPDDCTKLQDGCQDLFVKKNDTSIHCFTGQPINSQQMVNAVHPDTYIGTAKAPGEKEKAKSSVGQAPQLSSREALFVPLPKLKYQNSFRYNPGLELILAELRPFELILGNYLHCRYGVCRINYSYNFRCIFLKSCILIVSILKMCMCIFDGIAINFNGITAF